MGNVMKESTFSLAEVKYAHSANINHLVLQNVTKSQIKVKSAKENVAGKLTAHCKRNLSTIFFTGVVLPVFEVMNAGGHSKLFGCPRYGY